MFVLDSPLTVPQSKKKNFTLGLNQYRNSHFLVLNKVKIVYKELMKQQIEKLPKFTKVKITYTLFPKTKRLTDLDNICSIHSKFFMDALTELDRIQDDNYLYVPEISFNFGKVDKDNPRVEIVITELK